MGTCCSCRRGGNFQGTFIHQDDNGKRGGAGDDDDDNEDIVLRGDAGARVRLQGSSKYVSMFSQQGRKGVNQDAMTVWEGFSGDKDMFLCAVFDGHGPSGHKVARYLRDSLPAKISSFYKQQSSSSSSQAKDNGILDIVDVNSGNSSQNSENNNPFFLSWKARLIKCFEEMDAELELDASIESYCSGSTSVTVLKKGEHLVIANLGDSRAVLCRRDENNQLVSQQLTVDLKPNLPNEAQRIRSCQGRVLSMEEEPSVYRIWMPDQDCPGLAMARAFGDFCLKDFGLISTPEVTYRKLTEKDEFVVLATDGIWDVLSNNEVVKIVSSAKKRSLAAKLLVEKAAKAWRYKYPFAKIDDCAAICLFFKRQRPLLTKSISQMTHLSLNYTELAASHAYAARAKSDDGLDTVLNCEVNEVAGPEKNGDDKLDPELIRPRKRRHGATKTEYVGE